MPSSGERSERLRDAPADGEAMGCDSALSAEGHEAHNALACGTHDEHMRFTGCPPIWAACQDELRMRAEGR
jgi:hypothetical protein